MTQTTVTNLTADKISTTDYTDHTKQHGSYVDADNETTFLIYERDLTHTAAKA